MAYGELKKLTSIRPFQPVEITTSDGRVFTLNHPEMFLLYKTILNVQLSETDEERISLLHIVSAKVRTPEQPSEQPSEQSAG